MSCCHQKSYEKQLAIGTFKGWLSKGLLNSRLGVGLGRADGVGVGSKVVCTNSVGGSISWLQKA